MALTPGKRPIGHMPLLGKPVKLTPCPGFQTWEHASYFYFEKRYEFESYKTKFLICCLTFSVVLLCTVDPEHAFTTIITHSIPLAARSIWQIILNEKQMQLRRLFKYLPTNVNIEVTIRD